MQIPTWIVNSAIFCLIFCLKTDFFILLFIHCRGFHCGSFKPPWLSRTCYPANLNNWGKSLLTFTLTELYCIPVEPFKISVIMAAHHKSNFCGRRAKAAPCSGLPALMKYKLNLLVHLASVLFTFHNYLHWAEVMTANGVGAVKKSTMYQSLLPLVVVVVTM